jgi:hypothetical protein
MNFEAVAFWRPSSTGRPLEQRNPNLKISPTSINDFGVGQGYSPINLIMAARCCSRDEAFQWLTAKLSGVNVFEMPSRSEQVKEQPQSEQAEQPRAIRFKLTSFNDMRPGTEPLYLVDELIPIAGLVDIWGKPKCFKSFWTLDLMFHVAMGWEYRDRGVRQGAVVYCAFEGAHGYKKRIEAIRRHYELDETLHVPLYVMPGQANLIQDHKTLIADLRAQLGDVSPIVVVLDTLNKSLNGSESKDTDMSAYIRAAEAIRDAFKCVVIIVHHCGLDDTRPRGHTSLPGAVDAQLAVAREGNAVTVTVEMMRDGPEETVVASLVEVIEVGEDQAGKTLTSLVVKPGEAPAAGTTGPKWKGNLSIFKRALTEALLNSPIEYHVANGPTVKAADLDDVRDEFYKIYVEEDDLSKDAKQRQPSQSTSRKELHRCIKKAQERNLIGVNITDTRKLIWFASAEHEPQSQKGDKQA